MNSRTRRAELLDAGVEVREVARDLAPGERLDVVDAAVGVVLLLGLAPDLLLEPGRAKDLHRAQLEVAGARVDRRARVALDRQAVTPWSRRNSAVDRPTRLPPTISTLSAFVGPWLTP